MFELEIRHNFESAHRLYTPNSPPKCQSIHGHSWWATVTIAGTEIDADGILVEFGAFKKAWRGWLDQHLDHHLLLAAADPMVRVLRDAFPKMRVCVLDENPTTEVLARLLAIEAARVLDAVKGTVDAHVVRVHVQETRVNAASYSLPARL